MVLLASEIKKAGGGSLLLEKAVIKKGEIPVLLAVVCKDANPERKNMLRDMGVWFQNKVVANIGKSALSLKKDVESAFEELCSDGEAEALRKKSEAGELSYMLCAGRNALVSGENAFLIRRSFGSISSEAVTDYSEDRFLLEEGAEVLLTDGKYSFSEDKNKLDCLFSAGNENALERSVREVTEDLSNISIICIKAEV